MPRIWLSLHIVLTVKSVWQYYVSSSDVLMLLEVFRRMVNDSLRIGLVNGVSSLRKLSLLSYNQLAITILQATTSSAQYHAPQEYSRLGRSLSDEGSQPERRTPSDSSSSLATDSR
jgi:phage FluMu protein gp41